MKKLTPQEIVKRSGFAQSIGQKWEHLYALLQETTKKNTHRIFRTENTLFWMELYKDGVAKVNILSAESDDVLDKRLMEFVQAIKKSGYKAVMFISDNLEEIKQLSQKIPLRANEIKVNNKTSYRVYIDVQGYQHQGQQ